MLQCVFKCMSQIFHLFQKYVVSVSSGCCKSRSRCCIYMHVARVCFKCFKYFRRMMQVFQLFRTYVASVLSRCCKSRSGCCIYMHVASICFKCFQMFHMYVCKCFIYVAYVSIGFQMFFQTFSQVFQIFISSVSYVLFCML